MKRFFRIASLTLVVAILMVALFHAPIFTAMAGYLDRDSPPRAADVVFVPGGDSYGHRILKAAELVRQGYAPKAVISGPSGNYGFYECDLAIPFAVKAGYPEAYFLRFPNNAHSTREESAVAADEFRKLGAKRVLLVTSDYHTRRAGSLFRSAAPELEFIVVAAPDEFFTVNGWWHDRQARKTFLTEWLKTVGEWFNL